MQPRVTTREFVSVRDIRERRGTMAIYGESVREVGLDGGGSLEFCVGLHTDYITRLIGL